MGMIWKLIISKVRFSWRGYVGCGVNSMVMALFPLTFRLYSVWGFVGLLFGPLGCE